MLAMMTALLIAGASPQAEAFAADAQARMLEGQGLAPDFRRRLAAMEPVDRFAVVIWLRRAGMLTGAAIPIEEMLAPLPQAAPEPAPEPEAAP